VIGIESKSAQIGGYRSLRDSRAVTACSEACLAKQVLVSRSRLLPPGPRWRAGCQCHRRRAVPKPRARALLWLV